MSARDHDFVLRIARMRYEDGLPQHAIAARLGISTATVSRALKRANRLGFIQIRVVPPSRRDAAHEEELRRRFGLRVALVVPTGPDDDATREALGQAVAAQLPGLLRPGMVVGVSDGLTTAAVAREAERLDVEGLEVVPLIGGVGQPEEPSHPQAVARELGRRLGARVWQLPVPAMVADGPTAAGLREAPIVRSAFATFGRCAVALVGVGGTRPDAAIVRHGVLDAAEMAEAAALGAVGSVCARFYDREGRPLASPFDGRTLAITLDGLRAVPLRIAVAIGADKLAAIRAALASGVANGLGTDTATAGGLLDAGGPPGRWP